MIRVVRPGIYRKDMNINLGTNTANDTTVITVEIANTQLHRERDLFNTIRYRQDPAKLLHGLGDLAWKVQRGIAK